VSLLAIAGFLMVLVFMILIMTKRLHPMVALILVPMAVAIGLGFGPQSGKWIVEGLRKVVPTTVMLCFAILYFGIMIDVGFFEPLIKRILRLVKGDPLKICVGTAILAAIVALDGDGATTYMVTCTALLPLHRRLGIKPMILPALCLMQVSILNILPWGGPSGRVLIVTETSVSQLFGPLAPSMIAGIIWVCIVAFYWGKQERKRLGIVDVEAMETSAQDHESAEGKVGRPAYVQWLNFVLTIGLIIGLVLEVIPLSAMFMVATALALIFNYPTVNAQSKIIADLARDCLAIVTMTFAAGKFIGIMQGSKMIDAMAKALVAAIPQSMGAHIGFISSFISIPGTFFLTNDAYYFGVLPVIFEASKEYAITPVAIGIASLIGQGSHLLSPLVPSTYLLVGLNRIEYGDFQRFTLLPCLSISMVMLIVALILGHVKL